MASANAAAPNEVVVVPVNPAALKNSYKLVVSTPGMQEVLYSELGLGSAPSDLSLTFNGQAVAVEKLADRLRFYVQTIGDRWNLTSVYWLTLESGPLMSAQPVAPAAGAAIAYEHGHWTDNKLYDSIYAGSDGDHWFNMTMAATPGTPISDLKAANVPVSMTLPARSEPSTFIAYVTAVLTPGSSYCLAGDKGYRLEAQMLSGASILDTQVNAWNPAPNCMLEPYSAVMFTTTANLDRCNCACCRTTAYNTGIILDRVSWERPVDLDFGGTAANGADFWTHAGAATFAMTNLPARWQLYNVTTLNAPQIVASGGAGAAQFNQAADAPASHYVLANLDAMKKPAVQANSPVDFGNVLAANAIYIGPASFSGELAPLLALRQQQGYTPLFVDVQKVFDVYGYGHYSAVAVRNFLRSQTDWQNQARRISVVLVGDGSFDPYNYEGVNDAANQDANRVPPYMADVDPFIREVPCDQCYAQLNGDDPRTGDNGTGVGGAWFACRHLGGPFPRTQRVRSERRRHEDRRLRDWRYQRRMARPAYLPDRQLYQGAGQRKQRRHRHSRRLPDDCRIDHQPVPSRR